MKPAVSKILAITIMFVCAVSCKKSDAGSGNTTKSKTILMTQASWKLQSVGLDNNRDGVAETDITSSVPACQFDNIYTFKADSTGIMDESSLKCNSTDPQTKAFTWLFKSNETILSGTFGFTDSDATILSLTDNNLTVTYDDVSGGITNHILAVLKH